MRGGGRARRAASGLRARILRCSTVYGERQRPDRGQGAVVTFLHRIERGEPVDLYGEGTTVRDYVYVGDVARACVELVGRTDGPPVLNVASGEGTSLLELLRLVEDELGRRAEVVEHPARGPSKSAGSYSTPPGCADLSASSRRRCRSGSPGPASGLPPTVVETDVKSSGGRGNGLRWRLRATRRVWARGPNPRMQMLAPESCPRRRTG